MMLDLHEPVFKVFNEKDYTSETTYMMKRTNGPNWSAPSAPPSNAKVIEKLYIWDEDPVDATIIERDYSDLVGVWPAVFIAGAVFGVAHFYQGVRGMIKAGVLGIAMAALFVGSGSLLWPMVLHVVMDLQAGAVGRRVLTAAPASVGG
jgi:hypothetical protein